MVVEELKEMGGGGGVGCYGGGVGVEKMVVVVNWKKMAKKKKVELVVVLRRKEMLMVVLLEMGERKEDGQSWDEALVGVMAGAPAVVLLGRRPSLGEEEEGKK